MIGLLSLAPVAFAEPLVLGHATAEELAALDGVSDEVAVAIVELAEARGGLGSVEELRILPGITDATLDSLRDHTVVPVEVPVGVAKTYETPDEVLAEFRGEPTVQQVQQWADAYARLSPETVTRWMAASKNFAALPRLTVRYYVRDGWDQGFEYSTAEGEAAPSAPGEEAIEVLDDASVDQDRYLYAEAQWYLSKLVMSSERIRMISESQDIVKLRDKILSEVTRIYFERRRVQVENLLTPKRDTMSAVKAELRLMELTASIDALTGGAFSQAVSRTAPAAASAPPPAPAPPAPAGDGE